MKKKILICIILCCSIFVTACANGVSNSNTSAEEEMIKAFYDAIYELNDEAQNDFDSSFETIIEKYDRPIKDLMEYKITEDTVYLDYIDQMQKNIFAIFINSQFLKEISEGTETDKIYKIMFGAPLEMATEEILSIELPFEYEQQAELEKDELDTKNAKDILIKSANDAIENGYNVEYKNLGTTGYVYISYVNNSNYTAGSKYEIGNYKVYISPIVYLFEGAGASEADLKIALEILIPNEIIDVSKVSIGEVEFNSTQLETYTSGETYVAINIDGSQLSADTKEKYQECLELFNNAEKIEIEISPEISFELTEYDIEQLRCYFNIYNNIKLLCN